MEEKNTKEALTELLNTALTDAKIELDNKRNHLQDSMDAIRALKEFSGEKQFPISNVIQTIVAVLVVIISLAGSWYNSKIQTNDFFNDLKYLRKDMTVLEEKIKRLESVGYDHSSDYKLLKQRIDLLIDQMNKK